jgi:hypothetical protein
MYKIELDMQDFQRAHTPECDLWAHVMRQALDDALWPNGKVSKVSHERVCIEEKRRNRRTARKWFMSNADYVGSFTFVCIHLDLIPEIIRGAVLNLIGVPEEDLIPTPRTPAPSRPIRVRPCDECHTDYQYQRKGSKFCHRCRLIPPNKRTVNEHSPTNG